MALSGVRTVLTVLAGLTLSAPATAQVEYEFILVEAFNINYSLRECYVTEINEQNVACGTSSSGSSYSGFVWTEAGDKQPIAATAPKGLNNAGLVVDNNFVLDTTSGVSTTVPGVAGFAVPRVRDVNDSGLVVGHAWVGTNCSQVTCYAPLLWDAANGSRLLTNVPQARNLVRINNSGQVLGHIARVTLDRPEAFVYDMNTSAWINLSDSLPPHWLAGHAITEAYDISDTGAVAGYAQFGMELPRAFLWRPGLGHTFIPALAAGEVDRVQPEGLNASNVVVGAAAIAPSGSPGFAYHAFVWDAQNGTRDLNALTIPAPNFILDRAVKINDNGWIVGYGHFGPGWGTSRGFVLKPLTQPCYANCDGSTQAPVLNVADFTCFLQKFAAGDAYANCDASTQPPVLNVADFTCFLQKFAAGCP